MCWKISTPSNLKLRLSSIINFKPFVPSLLGKTASPPQPPGVVGSIGDINIEHSINIIILMWLLGQ